MPCKDVRIVIVSWNVEKLLERCLRSLPDACRGLDWECVVVDNASTDGCVGATRRIAHMIPQIRVIANSTNLGFGNACNQGAEASASRYLLFLNPDTYAPPDALARFVKFAEERPRSGILGPRLIYPDGRPQASIRRCPDVWSQIGILLKLHRLIPWSRVFRRYFAKDSDETQEQNVEQVMGACFLVRRECWEEIGGFDKRFFLWFEEVDRCKAAIEQGWNVTYLPHVQMIHHGGESFAKAFTIQKQRYFNDSLIAYFEKWHPGWRVMLLRLCAPISIALASLVALCRRPAAPWIAVVVGVEAFSAIATFHPLVDSIATICAAIVIAILGWKKPTIGLGVLLLELLIGSKGGLLQYGVFPHTVNGRVIFTAAFLVGWMCGWMSWHRARLWREEERRSNLMKLVWERKPYLVLFILIAFATIRGIILGHADVYHDANAWAYLAMLFPVLDLTSRYPERIRRDLTPIFFVGLFWIAFKTLILEYLFSNFGFFSTTTPDVRRPTSWIYLVYLWIRRTGVGEITPIIGTAYRIFMQSYVYAVAAWLIAFVCWMRPHSVLKRRTRALIWCVMCASSFLLVISLSRSFWIAVGIGGLAAVGMLFFGRERIPVTNFIRRLWGPLTAKVFALSLLTVIISPTSVFDLFFARANIAEPAAASRWALLPKLVEKIREHPILGSGFGATVTYVTKDPRVLETHPDGVYTTYAFEWGWLEHWVKLGILGIPVMLWLLVSLARRMWISKNMGVGRRMSRPKVGIPIEVSGSGVACLIAIGILHIFTPYLNHPLGFLYLLIGEGMIVLNENKNV